MINPLLHRQPVAVDRNAHRFVRIKTPVTDWSPAARLNALFVAATEFGDAARDFPLVFVRAGDDDDGKPAIAPIAICLDSGWSGLSGTEGERLFDAEGQQSPFLNEMQRQLEVLDGETRRTRIMCRQLRDHDLLREMRFDATLPGGAKLAVDGFLTGDEKKLETLGDAAVLELHRSGLLGLIHAHYVSLGNMRKLLAWHIARLPA